MSASPGEFFATLMHGATAAHMLHLRTRSHAAHLALDELYKGLPGLVDALAEAYQGRNGVVTGYPGGFEPPGDDPGEFVRGLLAYVDENRGAVGDETELQNMADEVAGLLAGVLYKLRFLS